MDYEKKYKDALERARQFSEHPLQEDSSNIVEYIFPELKESEDERIRKLLISGMKNLNYNAETFASIPIKDVIAWLEKQGEQKTSVVDFKAKDWYVSKVDGKIYNAKFMEKTPTNQARKLEIEKAAMSATGIIKQEEWFIKGAEWSDKNPSYICSEKQNEQKPTDKVEPKFKVGDWIVDKNGTVQQILSYGNDVYKHTNGYSSKMFENEWRLWDITKDAKDGEVLATPNYIYIFNSIDKETETVAFYCLIKKSDKHFSFGDYRIQDEILNSTPATKEQRDTLLKAMTDAGWEFDFEKKGLKKISQRMVSAEAKEALYDKPAWTEEDEDIVNEEVEVTNIYETDRD